MYLILIDMTGWIESEFCDIYRKDSDTKLVQKRSFHVKWAIINVLNYNNKRNLYSANFMHNDQLPDIISPNIILFLGWTSTYGSYVPF